MRPTKDLSGEQKARLDTWLVYRHAKRSTYAGGGASVAWLVYRLAKRSTYTGGECGGKEGQEGRSGEGWVRVGKAGEGCE